MTERCPKCLNERHAGDEQCPKCGIIFSKFDPEEYKELLARREALRRQSIARIRPDKHAPKDRKSSATSAVKNSDGTQASAEKKDLPAWRQIISSTVFGAILIGFLFSINNRSSNPKPRDYSTEAYVHCQDLVKARLRAPSTADFPFLDRKTWSMGNNTYLIKSYVDAQNGFGVKIRNNWHCKIKFLGGNVLDQRSWRALEIEIL